MQLEPVVKQKIRNILGGFGKLCNKKQHACPKRSSRNGHIGTLSNYNQRAL